MKMTTALTTTTKIKDISKHTFTSKDGKETSIVIVQTEDGNFSNFESIWKKQKLDLDNIKEGDFVEITYTTYFDTKHSHEYKNFLQIRAIEENQDDVLLG